LRLSFKQQVCGFCNMTKKDQIKTALLIFGAVFLSALPALANHGHPACGSRQDVEAELLSKYGEAPRSAGLAKNGQIIKVTVADNGDWTMISVRPDGFTCLFLVGEAWRDIEPIKEDDPA